MAKCNVGGEKAKLLNTFEPAWNSSTYPGAGIFCALQPDLACEIDRNAENFKFYIKCPKVRPYWIRHFELCIFDSRFVISDPKNPPNVIFIKFARIVLELRKGVERGWFPPFMAVSF